MVFSSPIFLFLFLPVVLGVYFVLPFRAGNLWLLLSSLVFYGWGEPQFVLVMLASILANYAFGFWIDRVRDRPIADLVSRERPDVVIREIVERSLMSPPPDEPGPGAPPARGTIKKTS